MNVIGSPGGSQVSTQNKNIKNHPITATLNFSTEVPLFQHLRNRQNTFMNFLYWVQFKIGN